MYLFYYKKGGERGSNLHMLDEVTLPLSMSRLHTHVGLYVCLEATNMYFVCQI